MKKGSIWWSVFGVIWSKNILGNRMILLISNVMTVDSTGGTGFGSLLSLANDFVEPLWLITTLLFESTLILASELEILAKLLLSSLSICLMSSLSLVAKMSTSPWMSLVGTLVPAITYKRKNWCHVDPLEMIQVNINIVTKKKNEMYYVLISSSIGDKLEG